MATEEFSSVKSNSTEQTKIKYVTLEKPKRSVNRKANFSTQAAELMNTIIQDQSEGNIETLEPIAEKHIQEIQTKSINGRVKNVMTNTINYTKISQLPNDKQQVTGKLIDLTLVVDGDLCVIDFDINKNLSKEKIDEIRQNIIDNMLPVNVDLVKIAHGGLHANCNKNGFIQPANRCMKCTIIDNIEINIFEQMFKHKEYSEDPEQQELIQNRIVGLNSSFGETKNNKRETLKYEAVNDWTNMTHLASLRETLDKWNVDIEISYAEYIDKKQKREFCQQITDYGTIDKMNDELAQACIDGFKNLTIHNYPQAIAMKIQLLNVFSGLYGITNEKVRAEGIANIRQYNKLTANAKMNYGYAASQGERKPNPWILTKILKYHNKDYNEQSIKPLLKKNYEQKKMEKQIIVNQTLIPNKIDLQDGFTLLDMQEKAVNGEYENEEQIFMDLSRLLIYYEGETEDIYAIKGYDTICDTQVLYHKLKGTVYKQLEKINKNFKNKKSQEKSDDNKESKPLTAKHIFKKYTSKFAKKGCKFISEDPKILTVFQGYKYKKLDTIDYECLQICFDLIKETIAAGDISVNEYILKWIAWMIQNPRKKSSAAIVQQGRQGIGKKQIH
ncbi:MAG: hypothetical protein EZS28_020945 [Streblomastix strix]|uniref:Uncharacterized protein n=1 Tax=Streblomastix strix TaxID=222440 RepID=A0A5J4VMH5_9EUKA|nr:MAG: hypothetical protein EZS28_020945 [Streblomastix strix]